MKLPETLPPTALPPASESGTPAPPVRRVREEVRDGVAVIVFSAAASCGVVALVVLVSVLAG